MRKKHEFKVIVSIISMLIVSISLWQAAYVGIYLPSHSKQIAYIDNTNSSADNKTTNTTDDKTTTTTKTTSKPTSTSTAETSNLKVFTLNELSQYTGLNGKPAYIAIGGTVYDVTNVLGWRNGNHQGYQAGQDLTSAFASSPHSASLLNTLTVVGKLAS